MRISDWITDVCSSVLIGEDGRTGPAEGARALERDVRRLAADAGDISQTLGLESFGRDGRDGDRNLLRTLGPLLRRHDDVLQAASLLFGRRRLLRRSEEHTSELQSLMRISYAVFCLKKKKA